VNHSAESTFPQVGVGAVVIKEEKILLVKRNKSPQKGKWAIPGGSVELGETLQEAAEREIREETSLRIKAREPVYCFDLIERNEKGELKFHYVIIDLEADYIWGELHPSDDVLDAKWFHAKELNHINMTKSTRDLLQKIGFFQ
jgi:ADP-ribose pyrophosphatase